MVWSGWGWLGYVIIGCAIVAAMRLCDALAGPQFLRANHWVFAGSWVVSSAACWLLGRRLNRSLPVRVLGFRSIHDATAEGHTIFFLRLEFGGLVGLPIHVALIAMGPQYLNR